MKKKTQTEGPRCKSMYVICFGQTSTKWQQGNCYIEDFKSQELILDVYTKVRYETFINVTGKM